MKTVVLTLSLYLLIAIMASGQSGMNGLLGRKDLIYDDLLDYDTIAFAWNMSGIVQADLNDGINFLEEKNAGAAVGALTKAIKIDSSLWMSYYYRAIGHKLTGDFRSAERDLRRAIRLGDDRPIFFLELGRIKQLKEEFDAARRFYEKYGRQDQDRSRANYFIGNLNLSIGDLRGAKSAFEKCQGSGQIAADANVRLALLQAIETGKTSTAMPFIDAALKIDSLHEGALILRGVYRAETEPNQSLADFSTLVKLKPTNVNFRVLRGFLLTQMGDYEKAFSDLHKAIQENQQSTNGYRGAQNFLDRRLDLQYAGYYTILHLYGMNDSTASAVKKGFCLLITGKHQDAIEAFTEAQYKDTTAVSRFLSAIAHDHSGQHFKAFRLYETALKMDNDILDAHKKRGVYKSEMQQWDDAILDFNEMIRINPEAITAYRFRGIAYFQKGEFQRAKGDFSSFIERDTTDEEIFDLRAACYKKLGDELNASRDLLIASKNDQTRFPGFEEAVNLLLKSGDTAMVESAINQYIERFPDYLAARTLRIRVLEQKRDWEGISKEIDGALSMIHPFIYEIVGYSYLLTVKGKSLAYHKNYKEAIKILTEAIRINTKNGEAYLERAKIFLATNKTALAKQDLIMAKNFGAAEAEKLLNENQN